MCDYHKLASKHIQTYIQQMFRRI